MVTIYDIAKATGYSAPTVSRALTGTGKLTAETRQKIIAAAKSMGYEPNSVARSLTTKKTNLIGIIYDDIQMARGFTHPLFSGVLDTFREAVEKQGYDIIFLSRYFKMSYLAHARYRAVEGVAIINPETGHYTKYEEFSGDDIPCVSTSAIIPGICSVLSENEEAGYQAAKFLVSMGHKKIAYLSGPFDSYSMAAIERYTGFKRALSDCGIAMDESYFEKCDAWYARSGKEGFERLYARHSDMTAVFTSSDLLATGIMQAAGEKGIRLPDDLSIIGFDDDKVSEFITPSLTTFRQNSRMIAQKAAELLLGAIGGKKIESDFVRIPAEFIVRDSVKRLES